MSNNTAVAVIPADFQLPAHLRTADAAAAIAAANAAAAGGIKGGSYPRLSKKGSKFHIIDGDEVQTLFEPPTQPGAPALPKMLLQVVIVSANPGISKTLYINDFNESDAGHEPDCKSNDGIRPDSTAANPQHSNCAQCPKNQWGSKISKMSGKETKACTDMKQLVILPRGDLKFKAVGLSLTPSELKDWGNYVKALTGRSIPVNAVWTNLTFDANATHPKLVFSFAGVLTADEYQQVQERAKGDDVKNILQPSAGVPALPAPAALTPPPTQPAPVQPQPQSAVSVVADTAAPAAAPVVTNGFGAIASEAGPAIPAVAPNGFGAVATTPPADPPKRTRSPRKPPQEAQDAAAQAAAGAAANVAAIGAQAAQAAQATNATASDPYAGLGAHVKIAVEAAKAANTDYKQVYLALAGRPFPEAPAAPVAPPPTVTPISNGFGAAAATAASAAAVTAAQVTPGQSIKERLAAAIAAGQKAA